MKKLLNLKSCKAVKGQSLLEVLVGLSLLAVVLSSVLIAQLTAMKNADNARKKSQATKLAQEQIERARVFRDFSTIDSLANLCLNKTCYINSRLEALPVTPTGIYGQTLTLQTVGAECPTPAGGASLNPTPVSYKATAVTTWRKNEAQPFPALEATVSSCISNWR
jgi:type II secretory pathway pseudopilin PulG